jgi:hypothetical protein
VLASGGLLVTIARTARQPGQLAGLIARARAAGLSYTQHIVAMHARITGSGLAADLPPPSWPGPAGRPDPGRHMTVHTDLPVFANGA